MSSSYDEADKEKMWNRIISAARVAVRQQGHCIPIVPANPHSQYLLKDAETLAVAAARESKITKFITALIISGQNGDCKYG